MERFIARLIVNKAREVVKNGRRFLVVPTTILVPGVLNGSRGPLYYPPKEARANPGVWNGIPAVLYHPTDGKGRPVSALENPKVVEEHGLGFLHNDRWNGKRQVNVWFDVERVENHDRVLRKQGKPELLPRILGGEPIEVSTGLHTDNFPVKNGYDPKSGRTYTHVARNYRPDHLAILPDQKGACSVDDGCGAGVENVLSGDRRAWVRSLLERVLAARTDNANPKGCNQHKKCGTAKAAPKGTDPKLVKAAEAKVKRVQARLDSAKAKVKEIGGQLKSAKADLRAVKSRARSDAGAAKVNQGNVDRLAGWLGSARKGKLYSEADASPIRPQLAKMSKSDLLAGLKGGGVTARRSETKKALADRAYRMITAGARAIEANRV